MNKIIISFIAVLLPLFAFAQSQTGSTADSSEVTYGQPSTVKYFGEIVYTDISAPAKKTIQIDFGVNSIFGKRYPDFKDENALNYMSARGWVLELEYEDAYIDEGSSYGSVKHFVISKTLTVQNKPKEGAGAD
jgi:hypothetical protein